MVIGVEAIKSKYPGRKRSKKVVEGKQGQQSSQTTRPTLPLESTASQAKMKPGEEREKGKQGG